jgi:hypothetical protein
MGRQIRPYEKLILCAEVFAAIFSGPSVYFLIFLARWLFAPAGVFGGGNLPKSRYFRKFGPLR